ncbi:MAG: hypothetical protein NC211_03065 [Alistipes senegalensis]|nr:hypothetical protein [Oxalobacter formigenes]MCM1280802.1 hypothetical protein [Alistipes senegalensis]
MNMLAICKIINNIIFHLAAVQKIDEANFTNIDSFFDKSIKLVDDVGRELYSAFYEKERFFIAFEKILQCRQVLLGFRSDLIRLHIDAIRNGWVNCFPMPKITCQFAMPFSREGFNLRMDNMRKDIESLMTILESICEKYLFGRDGKWRDMKPNLEKYADSMSQLY